MAPTPYVHTGLQIGTPMLREAQNGCMPRQRRFLRAPKVPYAELRSLDRSNCPWRWHHLCASGQCASSGSMHSAHKLLAFDVAAGSSEGLNTGFRSDEVGVPFAPRTVEGSPLEASLPKSLMRRPTSAPSRWGVSSIGRGGYYANVEVCDDARTARSDSHDGRVRNRPASTPSASVRKRPSSAPSVSSIAHPHRVAAYHAGAARPSSASDCRVSDVGEDAGESQGQPFAANARVARSPSASAKLNQRRQRNDEDHVRAISRASKARQEQSGSRGIGTKMWHTEIERKIQELEAFCGIKAA